MSDKPNTNDTQTMIVKRTEYDEYAVRVPAGLTGDAARDAATKLVEAHRRSHSVDLRDDTVVILARSKDWAVGPLPDGARVIPPIPGE